MLKLFLILVYIKNLYGLICYSDGSFNYSRNEFHMINFENRIQSTYSSCHVRITIDYNTNNVNILFNPSRNHSIIEFGSRINLIKNQIQSIISYFDYTCLNENLCEKIFLEKWAKQLLNSSENSLHKSFILSLKDSNICPSDQCESYLCFMIYDELKSFSYCNHKSSSIPINIHIKTSGDYSSNYQCKKNHCTNELVYNSRLEKNSTKLSIKNIHHEYEVIFRRTIIIVGILLFIGSIAYYIQCKKYRQGYRLTVNV